MTTIRKSDTFPSSHQDITHVINFDFPRDIDEYVHRVGRTGRAGKTGCAMSFIGREDWRRAGDLIPIMQEAGQEVPNFLVDMAARYQGPQWQTFGWRIPTVGQLRKISSIHFTCTCNINIIKQQYPAILFS